MIRILVFLLTLFNLSCSLINKDNIEESFSESINGEEENFNVFLKDFSTDSSFQLSRVIFPFNDCYVEPTGDSLCEVVEKPNWTHLRLIEEGEIKTIKSINKDNPNKRVFAIEGIENGVGSYYYFEKDEIKWYLKHRISYE